MRASFEVAICDLKFLNSARLRQFLQAGMVRKESVVAQTASRGGGEDPIEGEDAEEPGSAGFAVPAAVGIGAGDFFVAEHFHGVGFGEGDVGALLLQIDIFAVLRALENDSIG
jgi:hypothetical protein